LALSLWILQKELILINLLKMIISTLQSVAVIELDFGLPHLTVTSFVELTLIHTTGEVMTGQLSLRSSLDKSLLVLMDTFMQLAMMVRFTSELESLTLMKKVLLGKLLLMFLKDPDIDKFLEASAKPMPLI